MPSPSSGGVSNTSKAGAANTDVRVSPAIVTAVTIEASTRPSPPSRRRAVICAVTSAATSTGATIATKTINEPAAPDQVEASRNHHDIESSTLAATCSNS